MTRHASTGRAGRFSIRHLRTETIARFRAEDLSPRKAGRVQAHLARCSQCAATSASLGGVTDLLASVPPAAIPDAFAARIETALRAEAVARSARGPATERSRGELPERGPAPSRRLPGRSARPGLRLAAAAGAVAILAGGGYVISQVGGSKQGTSSTASGAGHFAAPRPGGNGAAKISLGQQIPYRPAGRPKAITPVYSGTNYLQRTLVTQVRHEIAVVSSARSTRAAPRPAAGPTDGPAAGPIAGSAAGSAGGSAAGQPGDGEFSGTLAACVARISAGRRLELVNVARYQGDAAAVIVVAPSKAGQAEIVVVGPGCSGSRSDILVTRALPPG